MLGNPLAEFDALEALIEQGQPYLQVRRLGTVQAGEAALPLLLISLGSDDVSKPGIGFFGGVHGLERIGADVVTAYLRSLVMRLPWDEALHHQLQQVRIVMMPRVNPGGLWLGTRANPRGVDLMRNAPIDATESVPFMVGGQRLSAEMPWYRGPAKGPMELESAALCSAVEQELHPRPFSLTVDCHSGFGLQDRLWFPYAHTARPIPHLPEVHALSQIFEQTMVHHRYVFEPQSLQYLTHGDLWDYLYQRSLGAAEKVFLPLTLEMGSWLWIKKNPRQVFNRFGIFNPLIGHRQERVMRRQIALLDFFTHAAASARRWLPKLSSRADHAAMAQARWYSGRAP